MNTSISTATVIAITTATVMIMGISTTMDTVIAINTPRQF